MDLIYFLFLFLFIFFSLFSFYLPSKYQIPIHILFLSFTTLWICYSLSCWNLKLFMKELIQKTKLQKPLWRRDLEGSNMQSFFYDNLLDLFWCCISLELHYLFAFLETILPIPKQKIKFMGIASTVCFQKLLHYLHLVLSFSHTKHVTNFLLKSLCSTVRIFCMCSLSSSDIWI